MKRQVAEVGPNGQTRWVYRDEGPRSAVVGHGRPTVKSKSSTGGGSRQMRLAPGGRLS